MNLKSSMGDSELVRARYKFRNVIRLAQDRISDLDEGGYSSENDSVVVKCEYGWLNQQQQQHPKTASDRANVKSIFKMYERSVELSQFPENTPLYPVCREWLHEKPRKDARSKRFKWKLSSGNQSKLPDVAPGTTKLVNDQVQVYDLPSPTPSTSVYDIMGNQISSSIPPAVPPPPSAGSALDYVTCSSNGNDSVLPSPQTLYSENISHWIQVRKQWKQQAALNESRYAESLKIIKSCFTEKTT